MLFAVMAREAVNSAVTVGYVIGTVGVMDRTLYLQSGGCEFYPRTSHFATKGLC